MRLVIKEYLLMLKEKDELDLLLCDLLFQMGYIVDSVPKTGNRQYGVDIRAHNQEETMLFVVKQGDLNRKKWDSDSNAVRQSLDEIKDVYSELIDKSCEKLHIIVATNGVLEETVRPNWEGYKKQNKAWDKVSVDIDFWNIDCLTDFVHRYLFDEHVFDVKLQSQLRRALYFVEENGYRNHYFECITDSFISQLSDNDTVKDFRKKISALYLATQMIAEYAAEHGSYKIGIMVTEYLIIRYWKYLLDHDKLGTSKYIDWLLSFLAAYEKWNQKYYDTVKCIFEGPNRLPFSNPVEQRVVLYEIMGYLCSYAYYQFYKAKHSPKINIRLQEIVNSIVQAIKNYPQFFNAPYDISIGIISMLFRLFNILDRKDDVIFLLHALCNWTAIYYTAYKKYPSSADSFEDAINIEFGFPAEEYISSAFWGTILEWVVLLDQKKIYDDVKPYLSNEFKEVTKCTWFLRAKDESKFYDRYAMNLAGEGTAFEIEKSFEKFKERVSFIMDQYREETFSYETYSFDALEFIVCRYYGYLVRVKQENNSLDSLPND